MNEAADVLNGNLVQNLKSNWMDIAIIAGALIVLVVIVSIVRRRLRRVFERKIPKSRMIIRKRTLTLNSVISNIIIIAAVIAALLIIAGELGISVTPILAGAGVAGIVIGFGAQNLIKDIINGVFILFEQWYQVDDIIEVGDISGVVERFNLRTTVIRDLEGTVHYIPNGEISVLGNRSNKWSRAVLDVAVHYKEDTDRVAGILEKIFDNFSQDNKYKRKLLEKPYIMGDGGVSELGDSAVVFKVICKVKPGEQWTIERQLNKRIKDRFDKEGIEIPFPCNNVYIRNNENNAR